MENGNSEYNIETNPRSPRRLAKLSGVLVVVLALVAVVYYSTKVNEAASSESHPANFTIAKGEASKQIAAQLAEQKIISSYWVFRVYTVLHNAGTKMQAGEYQLDANMPITQIVDILTRGLVVSDERTLTIIEGWSNKQIADYLVSQKLLSSPQSFSTVLSGQFDFKYADVVKGFDYQGFLFPDSYRVGRDDNAQTFVQKMLTNFQAKITDKMLADMQNSGKNLKDVIILASIIEKEIGRNTTTITPADVSQLQTERTLAASVFYNRLASHVALESDATVNYVIGKTGGIPTLDEVRTKSLYNTYLHQGLPPGPISNPGIGSIMAAIYPANTDYMYFITKPSGEAVFAKTLAEHNANRAKYLGK